MGEIPRRVSPRRERPDNAMFTLRIWFGEQPRRAGASTCKVGVVHPHVGDWHRAPGTGRRRGRRRGGAFDVEGDTVPRVLSKSVGWPLFMLRTSEAAPGPS